MSDLIWFTDRQMKRIEPYFPLSHGVPRVDNRRVLSGNRFIRWSRLGVFNRILAELAGMAGMPDQVMIDATHLKAHRTAASLQKKGLFPDV